MKYLRFILAVLEIAFTIAVAVVIFRDLLNIDLISPRNDNSQISPSASGNRLKEDFPMHKGVVVSVFWVGEGASFGNNFISNSASAWDENWEEHFGGVDDPKNRSGFLPADFAPKENPFYFALPYNDFDQQGSRKPQASSVVYWSDEKKWGEQESMCKNRWIKISKDGLSAYAQWEDVGPFGEDDANYVFGQANPSNTKKSEAGLDVSPAVKDYLGLSGIDTINWQFVQDKDVPNGPWKQTVTTRNGN